MTSLQAPPRLRHSVITHLLFAKLREVQSQYFPGLPDWPCWCAFLQVHAMLFAKGQEGQRNASKGSGTCAEQRRGQPGIQRLPALLAHNSAQRVPRPPVQRQHPMYAVLDCTSKAAQLQSPQSSLSGVSPAKA